MAEYIVSLKKDVDCESFHNEMTTEFGSDTVPRRTVDVINDRKAISRLFHYNLNKAEADLLRLDSRVLAVELNPMDNPLIEHSFSAVQVANFTKPDTQWWENYVNWGLKRCSSETNIYGTSESIDDNAYNYPLDGSGVDIVVMDSGVDITHPEFFDKNNSSRVKTINWPIESGLTDILQPQSHYSDVDGHGTHVAGICAGKTFGWAKNAHIYPMHINLGRDLNGFTITDAFDLILEWHRKKLREGNNRPTIVNMSWGTIVKVSSSATIVAGIYRGEPWNFTDRDITREYIYENFGIVKYFDNVLRFPAQVSAYDIATEELISAGIHVVIAAGNIPLKIDTPLGVDYNNLLYFDQDNSSYVQYTNRIGSPYAQDSILVGNVDDEANADGIDTPANSATRGPVIDIWAPGTNIMSAYTSNPGLVFRPSGTYHLNNRFRQAVISGSSMAAPQATGLSANILQMHPMYTPAQLKEKLKLDAIPGQISTTEFDDDWTSNETALWGSTTRMMYNKFTTAEPGTFDTIDYVNFAQSSVR